MNTYEIKVTNIDNTNEIATFEVMTDESHTAQTVVEMFERTVAPCDIELEIAGIGFITVTESSDGDGYNYNVYETREDHEDGKDSIDGGLCTGTILDALMMARM